jgi:hypothetical protein
MALFKINYSAQAVPIEETALTDTNQTIRAIHSSIDKTVGGGIEKSYGETSTNVVKALVTTTSSYQALSDILSSTFNVGFLMVTILSAASSSTPEITISFDSGSTYLISAVGVGDVVMIPLLGDSQGLTVYSTTAIQIKSPGATSTANIEILVGAHGVQGA